MVLSSLPIRNYSRRIQCVYCVLTGTLLVFLLSEMSDFNARPLKNSSKLSLHGNEFSLILYKLSKDSVDSFY